MLIVRRQQVASLSSRAEAAFESRMVAHLRRSFPDRCAEGSDEFLLKAVRSGLRKAETYTITSRQDICLFLNLLTVFGEDFDCDPAFPWARKILRDPELGSWRMKCLVDRAMTHLRESDGGALDSQRNRK
jgi:hypothetical protein